jgi:F-type H+-transporting ATPase subunit epsilon
MAMTIQVEIVSAEAEIFSGAAEMVFVPAQMGEIGILPRHAPLLSPIKAGEIRIKKTDGKEESFYVSSGMVEIQPHVVTILADTALRADDIDEEKAEEAKRHAEKALKGEGKISYAEAQTELAEAIAQLQMARRLRSRKR